MQEWGRVKKMVTKRSAGRHGEHLGSVKVYEMMCVCVWRGGGCVFWGGEIEKAQVSMLCLY